MNTSEQCQVVNGIDFSDLVIMGVVYTDKPSVGTVQLSMVCRDFVAGKWGDRVLVRSFPALRACYPSIMWFDWLNIMGDFVIQAWLKRGTDGNVVYFQFQPGETPEKVKLPGVWSLQVER